MLHYAANPMHVAVQPAGSNLYRKLEDTTLLHVIWRYMSHLITLPQASTGSTCSFRNGNCCSHPKCSSLRAHRRVLLCLYLATLPSMRKDVTFEAHIAHTHVPFQLAESRSGPWPVVMMLHMQLLAGLSHDAAVHVLRATPKSLHQLIELWHHCCTQLQWKPTTTAPNCMEMT